MNKYDLYSKALRVGKEGQKLKQTHACAEKYTNLAMKRIYASGDIWLVDDLRLKLCLF